ncbi:HD domain-containing protein [Natrinema halophilum]|uniref:5'-deoxynucleotidase n=1 Tax=Natrinema halophilum TaxID=1699371 RepID=A0A7D5KN12_9EURY|nr:HD family hydrolase [Natrinema halophilum]QLG51258.1 HD family hydrolase [Natrinema halophilum]
MADDLDVRLEWLELKDERRTGWVCRGIENSESVAAHTWGTATLCLFYANRAEGAVDRDRAVSMALVHDLAEARTGDFATRADEASQRVSAEEKAVLERDAITDLLSPFESHECAPQSLWAEYEAGETATAQFVKVMDLLDNCLQALKYELEHRYDETETSDADSRFENLDEFFATSAPRLRTATGNALFGTIKARYERAIGRDCQL